MPLAVSVALGSNTDHASLLDSPDLSKLLSLDKMLMFILHSLYTVEDYLDIYRHDLLATHLWESGEELNKTQMKAIECALGRKFQLIQGPPGRK